MSNNNYMISLNLEAYNVLVVGGGSVGLRKLRGLPRNIASVTLVSPVVNDDVDAFISGLDIVTKVIKRNFEPHDIDHKDLVFAATSDRLVNCQIAKLCQACHILVNNVSDKMTSAFSNVAMVTRGSLSVGVSSKGGVPGFSLAIGKLIDEMLPSEVDDLMSLASQLRLRALEDGRSLNGVDWMKVFDSGIIELIRSGNLVRAEERLAQCLL